MNYMEKFTDQNKIDLSLFLQEKDRTLEELKRAQAILLLSQGASRETIALLTGLKKETVVKTRKKYIKNGISALLSKRKDKKLRSLLTKNQRIEFAAILHTRSPRNYGWDWDYWTPTIVAKLILELYGVQYKSKTSIYVIFKQSKITYHKPEKSYHKRNQALIDQWKKEHQEEVQKILTDEETILLVEDEMIVTSQTTSQKIWLPEGVTPNIQCSNTRTRRSFYGFLNIKTGEQFAFKSEKQNSETTAKILKKVLKMYPHKKVVLFWDNAPWHKGEAMRDFLTTCKNFLIINFPPYAPEENPQEHVWKAARANVTHNQFISDIDIITRQILTYLNNSTFKYEFFGFTAR